MESFGNYAGRSYKQDQVLTKSDGYKIWQNLSFDIVGIILVLPAGAERPWE